jgi:hypothetical protein
MPSKSGPASTASMSPVSPSRLDFSDALDVLNASINSALGGEMLDADAPAPNAPGALLEKCRVVIDDLQSELNSERVRVVELENIVENLSADLKQERKKVLEERALVDQLRLEIRGKSPEMIEIARELQDTKMRLFERENELENMTGYCEKRVIELKRALKDASTTFATPPLPVRPDNDEKVLQLTNQLEQRDSVLLMKESELKSVVESYEKQVRLLRAQLRSSEDLLSRLSTAVTPSPKPENQVNDWKVFIDPEFTKLNKTRLITGTKFPNPFSNSN